jgi:predicted acylesterase/phospholipase RssA/predicted small lipoprotein YifL
MAFTFKSGFRTAVVLATLLSVAACTSTRPLETADLRGVTPVHAVTLFDERNQPMKVIGETGKDVDTLDILAISGGGSNGAYGAGVIYGWTQTGGRPNFDIVTGVSTGALIAILAFAGPEYDEELKRLYTHQTNQTIYKEKGPISGLFSDSYYDYTPFKNQITRVVNAKLLEKVAQEYRKGRRLYIATTNIDAGKLVVWDIGALAASDRHNKILRSQKIIRASATVPGFFKPVYIKPRNGKEIRQAHVDGSVKAPVLIRNFMFERKAKKKNLYVLLNSQLKLADASKPVEPDVASISAKAISELIRGLTYKTVYQGYVTAKNAGANFKMTFIPDDADPIEFSLNFNQKKMRQLFNRGMADGQVTNAWRKEPPRLETYERIAGK